MEILTTPSDAGAPRTIVIQPTWVACMHILIAAIECGTDEGRRAAKKELLALADRLDRDNAEAAADNPPSTQA